MVELLETEVAESAGEVDETVGLVPSATRVILSEVTTETFPAESLYQA